MKEKEGLRKKRKLKKIRQNRQTIKIGLHNQNLEEVCKGTCQLYSNSP